MHELTELRSQNVALKKSMTGSISAELAAKEALRYAESIVGTVREPLLILDAELKSISANRSFYKTFKVTPGETIGSFIYDLGNKQWDIHRLRELLEEVLPEKEAFDDFEVDHHFQDIGHKIMLLNARQIYRKDIGAKMILLAIEDITERKRRENLLKESEKRYRRVFETANDGIVFFEQRQGKITHANPAIEKMLGYTQKEIIRSKLQDIGIMLDMGDFQTTIQNLDKSGIFNYRNVKAETKSGQHIDTEIYLVDRAELVQCNIRDITERKRAEAIQRAANAYNRSLIEVSIDPLVTINPDGKITDVNAATERVTGCTREALIGTDFTNYFSDPEMASVGYRRVLAEGHVHNYPLEIRHCDGRETPVLYNATLYHNEKGEVSGIFAAARDITVRKLAEAQLRASLQEKDLLLNEIHHRVKNNMQVISGLLSLQAKASKNPELIESFRESRDRIQAMTLVHEKLYSSKDFSKIGLAGYVKSLSQELYQSYNINQGKIDLTIQTDGEVFVDINKAIPCGLILNELISNALKHAFPGDRTGKLLIIIGKAKDIEIEIFVRDNGVGLPDDVDIHEPRSVGLHLVNGLVKNQLDGQLEVKRDNGTEFRIIFPL